MIYISSSCVRSSAIKDSIIKLVDYGFSAIEFSGGTRLYAEMENDILSLKTERNLNYLCHNYFPPPQQDFVLNIASLNEDIYKRSFDHVVNALKLSQKIGADKFAVHAGFLIDIPLNEIGISIASQRLFDEKKSKERFYSAMAELLSIANEYGIKLYVENNVVSEQNYKNFGSVNPFFVCTQADITELKKEVPGIEALIDIAHLKVSCNTLGFNYEEQAKQLIEETDYIHLSDNDGATDSNKEISEDSDTYKILSEINLKGKTITLEIYSGLDKVKESYNSINKLINA